MILHRAGRWLRRHWREVFPPQFDATAPFGTVIRADQATYLRLHKEACANFSPAIEAYLDRFPHQIDVAWMNELALHTQVVIKESALNFQHGRVLYTLLREYLDRNRDIPHVTVFETGTSRGFSAICMVRAMVDAERDGKLVTTDIIRHHSTHLWNCIDDHDGPRTRNELLAPWDKERDRIIFIGGDSKVTIPTIGLPRIHFSFLDGAHTEADVLFEYDYVKTRQVPGDVIMIDDVTPGKFDGIVKAVDQITSDGLYSVERLEAGDGRAYAIASRRA